MTCVLLARLAGDWLAGLTVDWLGSLAVDCFTAVNTDRSKAASMWLTSARVSYIRRNDDADMITAKLIRMVWSSLYQSESLQLETSC
ncbi:hypothetical protein ElyMa_005309200 [Elysia marginata]|uniref:Uncharacterized protein n=1 Tax=Elysia marginata TaxID=1093978 RepID=A0AAV4K3R5_9GAST|nr:hypothetical protein ElyMa_005309200 [Elysia marginata]